MRTDVTVLILTYNEEDNIGQALANVCDWAKEVVILDSFSQDRTLEIASQFPCQVFQNKFEGYATQRNYALRELPITTGWVLFLDADEWLSEELKQEIDGLIQANPKENGFYIKRRFLWMGKWIKRGYYPVWILRLFRPTHARCEDREINEHIVVEGDTGQLKHDFIHEDRRDITHWIEKHNKYATLEAKELIRQSEERQGYLGADFFGSQVEKKRWLKHYMWDNSPPLVRPFVYFFYRYILRGGFLDGKEAFIYHFLQGLWFIFLIDVKYLELKSKRRG